MASLRLILAMGLGLALACGDDDGATDSGTADVGMVDAPRVDAPTVDAPMADAPTADTRIPDDVLGETRTASADSLTENCTCFFADNGYADADECIADNGPSAADDACFTAAYTATESDVEGFFACTLAATQGYVTCMRAAACDEAATMACNEASDAATERCPDPSMAAATAFGAASDACYMEMVVGDASGCPDSEATSSEVGMSVFSGTTVLQGDDAEGECGSDGAPDVQLQWTAPSTGDFVIDTIGSNYDTMLYVLDGCEGTELECNDDEEETETLRSRLTLSATADTEYIIVVDGFSIGDAGDYVVNITAP